MENNVHTVRVNIDWKLLAIISELYSFDGAWEFLEQQKSSDLQQLREIATIRSVGASTRIEGAKMTNQEITLFLDKIDITEVKDRDQAEVLGYFEVLDTIIESYSNIPINETTILHFHNMLMRHSPKDAWHRGKYKQQDNAVQATLPNGESQIIFQTTPVGFPTQIAMEDLILWYNQDEETPVLIKCAIFVYEFLSIHPFQDGNGRMSRLLTTLLLLKEGYKWIQYVSFEHEIESKKVEYYKALRTCQANRPNEDTTPWVLFFFNAIRNIQGQLKEKLGRRNAKLELAPKEKAILDVIEKYSLLSSSQISQKLSIPAPTVKRLLRQLLDKKLIQKEGVGRAVKYRQN